VTVDPLSSMAVEVTATFDASIDEVWALLSDVERMAGLGPEHVAARWETAGPAVGARFTGRNRIGDLEWDVHCVVTACRPPEFIEWTVGEAPDHSSTWSYALSAEPGAASSGRPGAASSAEPGAASSGRPGAATVVVQRFRHGPGFSYVRQRVEQSPDRAQLVVVRRSEMLAANMDLTLRAAARLLDQGGGRADRRGTTGANGRPDG